jgi:hypothetical protein
MPEKCYCLIEKSRFRKKEGDRVCGVSGGNPPRPSGTPPKEGIPGGERKRIGGDSDPTTAGDVRIACVRKGGEK